MKFETKQLNNIEKAKAKCKSYGGKLFEPKDKQTEDLVAKWVKKVYKAKDYWIGFGNVYKVGLVNWNNKK